MTMKILATVEENEKVIIQDLFEKINALKSLVVTLADSNVVSINDNDMYNKLINDMKDTNRLYAEWWNNISDKYGIDKNILESVIIDFSNNILYIDI